MVDDSLCGIYKVIYAAFEMNLCIWIHRALVPLVVETGLLISFSGSIQRAEKYYIFHVRRLETLDTGQHRRYLL